MRSFVILALLCGVAAAQAPTDPVQAAEVAYQEGKRLYDLREWDQAIAKFKEAYKLRPDAAALFNIAQSYRLKGDCVEAVNFYKTFRRQFPNEKNVAKADKFIADLDECAKQHAAAPKTTPATSTTPTPTTTEPTTTNTGPAKTEPTVAEPEIERPPTPTPTQTTVAVHKPSGLRLAGLVVGGIGIAAVATGTYFGFSARSRADDVSTSSVWDQHLYDSGKAAERNAKILLGVGGAAVVGGVVMYILGRKAAESANVSIAPARGGASLVWSCEL